MPYYLDQLHNTSRLLRSEVPVPGWTEVPAFLEVAVFDCIQSGITFRITDGALELAADVCTDPNLTYDWAAKAWVDRRTPEQAAQDLQAIIVLATQARLDAFARTRNYDGILSAATYATSGVAKFALEGQHCVTARDATWATLYTVLAEVQAGTRPVPTGFADIEPLLPPLDWPTP